MCIRDSVWSEEPPSSTVLRELIAQKRLVVTPHLGANTQAASRPTACACSTATTSWT